MFNYKSKDPFDGIGVGARSTLPSNITRKSNSASSQIININDLFRTTGVVNPYKEHVWSYVCIKAISRNIASVPFKIRNVLRDGSKGEVITDQTNKWIKLFKNPNPMMVGLQFWKSISIYYELYGQAFLIPRDFSGVEAVSYNSEDVFQIDVVDPKCVKPWIVDNRAVGWEYTQGSSGSGGYRREQLTFDKIIRFYEFDPDNILDALSPSEVLKTSIGIDNNSHQYNEKFFENGASLNGYLSAEGEFGENLSDEDLEAMRNGWDSRYSGKNNYHKTPVLSNLKYVQTGVSQKDMDFGELMKTMRDEFIAAYGVNELQLGLSDSVNKATAEVLDKLFFTNTIIPKLREYASILNSTLFDGQAIECFFDESEIEALKKNRNEQIDGAKELRDLGYPLNEINESQSLGMAEVNQSWANEAVDTRPIVEDGTSTSTESQEDSKSLDSKKKILIQKVDFGGDFDDLSNKEIQELYDKEVLNAPSTKAYSKKLTGYFLALQKEQIKLVEGLGESKGITKGIEDEYLFDLDKWSDKLQENSLPYHETAFEDSFDFLEKEIGGFVEFSNGSAAVKKALKKKNILVRGITKRLRKRLRSELVEGVEANETTAQLQSRIRNEIGISRRSSLDIARTEVAQASGMAREEAMQVEGLEKEWITSGDKLVRSSHTKFQGLGQKPLKFEYDSGLKYPSDPSGPANEVINCRCFSRAKKKKS